MDKLDQLYTTQQEVAIISLICFGNLSFLLQQMILQKLS